MSAPSWSAALDDWASFLDELSEALDSGTWEDLAGRPPWQPPADLDVAPTPAEERRLLALTDRAGRLRDRLDGALARTAEELGQGRTRHRAAVAYLRVSGTSPGA